MNVEPMAAIGTRESPCNDESTVGLDLDREGRTMLVMFSGYQQGLGMPVLEFRRITQAVPAKLVFLRDPAQSWYHGNLPGAGNGPSRIAEYIGRLKAGAGCERLVCVGNSMGGYGALLVGSLAGADRVIAFSPQTFISRWLRLRHLDRRWGNRIPNARRSAGALRAAFDLAVFLRPPGYGRADIYADRSHRLDALHAHRLEQVDSTTIHFIDGGHVAIKRMRDSGELLAIIRAAVD